MGDFVFNIKGLTAQDRAQWEKDNIDALNKMQYFNWNDDAKDRVFKNYAFKNKFGNHKDYNTLKKMDAARRDSLYSATPDEIAPDYTLETLGQYADTNNAITEELNGWRSNEGKLIGKTASKWKDFDKYLDQISYYYKNYKGTEYFPLDDDKKIELMSRYDTDYEMFGPDVAAERMAKRIKTEVSLNQPLSDKFARGIHGAAMDITGGLIQAVAMIPGAAAGAYDAITNPNNEYNVIKAAIIGAVDNSWSRYANKIQQQGTFMPKEGDEAINYDEIITTSEEDEGSIADQLLSRNTLPTILRYTGFTISSMLQGRALGWLLKGAAYLTRAGMVGSKTAATVKNLEAINRNLERVARAERLANAYAIPSMVGTTEGAVNALQTKLDYLEDGKREVEKRYNEEVQKETEKRVNELEIPRDVIKSGQGELWLQQMEQLIKAQVAQELLPAYEDASKKVEENSDNALIVDLALNSGINGWINTVMKANMFHGRVGEALQRSKVGRLWNGEGFTLDKAGNVVAKEISKGRMAWNMAKESGGELVEEYSQDVADAFARGGAEQSLANYMDRRYSGEADDVIAETYTDNLVAAFSAAGKKAVSQDAVMSGIYGALGSIAGTPNVNTILSRSLYTRNAWTDKSWAERLNNIWRTPLIESYYNDKEENQTRRDAAKAMNEWLDKNGNRDLFTDVRGALSWAKRMQEAADKGDEFSFRNSRLGMTIQDYFMIEKLKGTPLYDAYLNNMMEIANAEEGSDIAKQIEEYTGRPLEESKRDAQAFLDIMGKVQKASAELEKTFGNTIPEDAKQSLIYGKLSIDDWKERATQLENEILSGNNTGVAAPVNDRQKQFIARFGSFDISDVVEKYDKIIENLKKRIAVLEKNSDILSETQKKELKKLKNDLKQEEKAKKRTLEEHSRLTEGIEKDDKGNALTPILSEYDILHLNPVDRYKMLNEENRKFYNERQQEIIRNLIDRKTADDPLFMEKIRDAARINDAQTIFYKEYNDALKDPNAISKISARLRYEARKEALDKSLENLNKIEDYSEFVSAWRDLTGTSSPGEISYMAQRLKDNPNFRTFLERNEVSQNIYKQLMKNDKLKDLSEEDKSLVMIMTDYLADRGVNIESIDDVISALDSVDSEGMSNLTKYINDINSRLEKSGINVRVSMDNIMQVVSNFKEALSEYINNKQLNEELNKEPEEKEVKPAEPAVPNAGIFGSESAEAGKPPVVVGGKPVRTDEKKPDEPDKPDKPDNTGGGAVISDEEPAANQPEKPATQYNPAIPDNFTARNGNNSEVMQAMSDVVDSIKSDKSLLSDKETKDAAVKALESLEDIEYEDSESLLNAVRNLTNYIDDERIISQIERAVGEAVKKANNRKSEQTKRETKPVEQKKTGRITLAEIPKGTSGFLSRKLEEWGVYKFVQDGNLGRTKADKGQIVFITDKEITDGVKQDMGDRYNEDNDLPVVLAVPYTGDGKAPVTVNGKGYQPIGILPSSQRDARAAEIRKLAKEKGPGLVSKGNQLLQTTAIVHSPREETSTSSETDTDVSAMIKAEDEKEKAALTGVFRSASATTDKFGNAIRNFINRLTVRKNPRTGVSELVYEKPTAKGDHGTSPHVILTKPFAETTDATGKRTLMDVIEAFRSTPDNLGNARSLINFNSRTKEFTEYLAGIFEMNLKDIKSDGNGGIIAEGEIEKFIEGINNALRRYIYPPASKKFQFRFNPKGDGLTLYLGDEKLGTVAASITDESVNADNMAEILANLIAPEGQFRDQTWWQIDKDPNFYKNKDNPQLFAYIQKLIGDDILRIGTSTLDREISGIEVDVPRALRDKSETPVVTNNDNATPTGQSDMADTQSGKKVDTDTGLTDKGKDVKNNIPSAAEEAKAKTEDIKRDSRKFRLSDDEKTYTDENGKTYTRVTSIGYADEEAGERFDSDNPWATPSQVIGNTVDQFIREYFENRITNGKIQFLNAETGKEEYRDLSEVYPNLGEGSLTALSNMVEEFKNYLEGTLGLNVISNGIVASGSLRVTDEDGKEHILPVAGTLDLLAYDANGKFHIYDMKTHHGAITDEMKAKWTRQLSLYKKFLEDKYGIEVASINIIPIKVNYNSPTDKNRYSVDNGRLIWNGRPYKASISRSNLKDNLITLTPKELNIRFDRLTEEERKLIDSALPIEEKAAPQQVNPQSESKPKKGLNMNYNINNEGLRREAPAADPNAKPIEINASNPAKELYDSLTDSEKENLIGMYGDEKTAREQWNNMSIEEQQTTKGCFI